MFGSYVFEVAIGLAFVYMLLSLLCSTINEQVITRFLSLRANTLNKAIQNMLADPHLAEEVYANPLIQGLSPVHSGKGSKPSYIPANIFAQTVMALNVVQDFKKDPEALESPIP